MQDNGGWGGGARLWQIASSSSVYGIILWIDDRGWSEEEKHLQSPQRYGNYGPQLTIMCITTNRWSNSHTLACQFAAYGKGSRWTGWTSWLLSLCYVVVAVAGATGKSRTDGQPELYVNGCWLFEMSSKLLIFSCSWPVHNPYPYLLISTLDHGGECCGMKNRMSCMCCQLPPIPHGSWVHWKRLTKWNQM